MRARSAFAALAGLCALLAAPRARAEDWLAVLPACALEPSANLPSFALLYPRPGLPAVLSAGDTLVARVRVPAPLTPPPGIQQAPALVGWSAELRGHAQPWQAPDTRVEQRHPLRVIDVRPDSGRSLIYRASIPLPAWLAPGTYDLYLNAPSGGGSADASVRVIVPERAPRFAFAANDWPAPSSALDALPVDVFAVSARSEEAEATAVAHEHAPFPLLDAGAFVGALRVGSSLWVGTGCAANSRAFDDEVQGVLAREHRARVELGPALAAARLRSFGNGATPWPSLHSLELRRDAARLRIHAESVLEGGELRLLLPNDAHALDLTSPRTSFHPAAELTRAPDSVLAILRLPAAEFVIERTPAPVLQPELRVEPRRVPSFGEVRGVVVRVPDGSRVAWQLDSDRTAFGPDHVLTRFGPLGKHRLAALVLAPDGRSAFLRGEVTVHTDLASSCRCALGRPRRLSPPGPALSFACVALLLLFRVRRKKLSRARSRNRLRADSG